MMCREYRGTLKSSEELVYKRLSRTTGMFESYVTEGDGIRQAAYASCPVFDVTGPNAQRQSEQIRRLTSELKKRTSQRNGH